MTEQPAATATKSADAMSRSRTVFMVAALVLSVISFMLNATMLAPAIRDINSHLGHNGFASMSSYYFLAGAIANVVLIRWSDYIGRKRVLLGILVLLCVGTVLCIVGTSLPVVVLGRALQGASNITFGLTFLIMRERLSPHVFGVCCGVVSAVNGGVAGSDALLAGFLVDRFGYRSIFVLTLAVGVAAVALCWKAVPADESGAADSGRMDWAGGGLIAVAVAGIVLYIGNGGHLGWSSRLALGFLSAAIIALVLFVVVERRTAQPLVHIDEMRSRYAWPLIAVTILCFASFMVVLSYIIPSIAENHRVGFGASGLMTALLFITPGAVVQLIVSPLIGRLAARIGFVTVLRAGIVCALAVTARQTHGHPADGLVRRSDGCDAHPACRAGRHPGTRRRARLTAGNQQCRVRYRRVDRICLGRNSCRGGHQGDLPLSVVDLRGHRRRRPRDQPDPQAAASPLIHARATDETRCARRRRRQQPSRTTPRSRHPPTPAIYHRSTHPARYRRRPAAPNR